MVAELQQRVRLQENVSERVDEISKDLVGDEATQKSPYGVEYLRKKSSLESQLKQSRSPLEEEFFAIQLERVARKLHGQLLSKIRFQAKAEAKKAQAEAEARRAATEDLRRAAKASLEMRKNLPNSHSPKIGFPKATRAFDPPLRKKWDDV